MLRRLLRLGALFSLLDVVLTHLDLSELDSALYDINIYKNPEASYEEPKDKDAALTISVANKHGQPFVCRLPTLTQSDVGNSEFDTSPNPKVAAAVVSSHLVNCIKHDAGWWQYLFCRGRKVLQSHGKETDGEYVTNTLGVYTGKHALFEEIIEGEKKLFLDEWYEMGAICDVTGAPRKTRVRYACNPRLTAKDAFIVGMEEAASCEYVLRVDVGSLCSMHAFVPPKEATALPINCTPTISADNADTVNKANTEKKNRKKRALEAQRLIALEMERLQLRRWSVERRRLETDGEKFAEKMRILDEDYIDLTRKYLETGVVAKTGFEATDEIQDLILELVDSMDEIRTPEGKYPSEKDEDRANVWHFMHNRRWRQDGFPLPLDVVDLMNGYYGHTESHKAIFLHHADEETLQRYLHMHPSEPEAVALFYGYEEMADLIGERIDLFGSFIHDITKLSTGEWSNADAKLQFREAVKEWMEDIDYDRNTMKVVRSVQDIVDGIALPYAMIKVYDMDVEKHTKSGTPQVSRRLAETINNLVVMREHLKLNIERWYLDDWGQKKGPMPEGPERWAEFAEEDYDYFYELYEGAKKPEEREATIEKYRIMLVKAADDVIRNVSQKLYKEVMREDMIEVGRNMLKRSRTAADKDVLGGATAAIFKDTADAEMLVRLLDASTGITTKTTLKVQVAEGKTLSPSELKAIEEYVEKEMADAKERNRAKQRAASYGFVFDAEAVGRPDGVVVV